MPERVVAPVVPASAARTAGHGRSAVLRALPVTEVVPVVDEPDLVYGMGRVDDSGRVSDRSVVRSLTWGCGDPLTAAVVAGVVVLCRDAMGVLAVAAKSYVVLPAGVRHRCGIRVGSRVLLAADPARGVLLVYPMGLLDRVLEPVHSGLIGGDPR